MTKRKTKAQREAEEIAALKQRLHDIYSGAEGCDWDEEEMWPTAETLSRVMPAIRDIFQIEGRGHLFSLSNLNKYETPSRAAAFLHRHGVRA